MRSERKSPSIRWRLTWFLVLAVALFAGLLFLTTRTVARNAVEQTQDRILGAATLAIAEELRSRDGGVDITIPYAAFSMLGAMGDDRVFYRIDVDGEAVTGYAQLPMPVETLSGLAPVFADGSFRGEPVRLAAVVRSVLVEDRVATVQIAVAQTRSTQVDIVANLARRSAALGLGFFALAGAMAVLLAWAVLRPVRRLAVSVTRRGPQDLRQVTRETPRELEPLVDALNGFISRLSGALSRAETFIAEAAHHIRTPLAALRAQSELALRADEEAEIKARLRKVVRLSDDAARTAGQLLDHAAVMYRADQRDDQPVALDALVDDVCEIYRAAAELRDIDLHFLPPPYPLFVAADPVLLESVARNLIDNAVKYSADESSLTVAVMADGDEALLEVLDRGRGLGAFETRALGKRFVRGDNVHDVVGSGLGLAIVAEVARLYGGSLTVEEREGGGVCARFSLPRSS